MDTADWIELSGLIGVPAVSGFYLIVRQGIGAARRAAEKASADAQAVADDLARHKLQTAEKAQDHAQAVAEKLSEFRIEVSKEYLSKSDFQTALRDLKDTFHREFNQHNEKISALFRKLDDVIQGNLFDRN